MLRTVLLRLVPPTPAGEPVVARVPTRVFAGSPEAPRLLDLLVRSRLVTVAHDTVTIAHESLVRAWPRLRTWLDEDVEGQRILAHLQVTADTWGTLGRPDDELYRGARLAAACEWRTRAHPVLAPVEDDFLTTATATADAERLRQVRRNRQLRGALVAAITLLAIAFVAGTIAGLNGRRAQSEAARASAEAARASAEAARAAAEAGRADAAAVGAVGARLAGTALNEPNPGLGLLLARQAVAISDNPTTQGALLNSLMNARGLVGLAKAPHEPVGWGFANAFTPDGRALLYGNHQTEVHLVDTTTGISRYGALPAGEFAYPSGLIDGGQVAVISDSRPATGADKLGEKSSVGLLPIEVATGDPAGPRQQVPGAKAHHSNPPEHPGDRLRITPDGRTLVSVLEGQVRIWHRRGQRWVGPQSVPIPGLARDDSEWTELGGATFSTAGDRAAVMFTRFTDPAVRQPAGVVIDLRRVQLIGPASLARPGNGLAHMAISPDGATLLVGYADGSVRVQGVADDQVLHTIPGQSPVTIVAWSPKGRRFAIGRQDGTSEMYSLDPLRLVMLNSGSDPVSVIGFVGEHGVVRESSTGSITRYDLDALSPVATQVATPPIHALDAAAGLIAQGEDNGRVTIRDAATLKQIGKKLTLGPYRSRDRRPQMAPRRQVTALALTPDGSAVIAADGVGHLRMWSLPGRELLWSRDDVPTSWLAVSPDGRYLATVGNTFDDAVPFSGPVTSTFTVWNLGTRTVHLSEDLYDWRKIPMPTSVVFSPDGSRVAIAFNDGFVAIYDVARRDRMWEVETHETAPSIVFTPDGQRLLLASPTYLKQADATIGRELSRSPLPGPRDATRMTYTEDGRWLVISHPRSLTVLDAQTLQVAVADMLLPTEVPTDTFPDAFAVVAGQDHQLLVGTGSILASIEMVPEEWKSAACQVAARQLTEDELTKEEWNHFLPGIPYSPACH